MSREDTPDLLDVLAEFERKILDNIHTAMPGRIESYDPATQRADVQPLIRQRVPKADTDEREHVYEDLPLIPSVRVLHPRGGGAFVHLPIAAGDTVLLVFCSSGIGHWEAGDGSIQDAGDERRHHPAHAVAIPGMYPAAKNIPSEDARTDELVLGFEGGTAVRLRRGDHASPSTIVIETSANVFLAGEAGAQFMARADRVDAAIDALRAALNTHTHTLTATGTLTPPSTALAVSGTTSPATPLPAPLASSAADQVKGK